MKNLIIGLAAILVSASAFAGGVSGGGGSTKPPHPVSRDEVWRTAQDARKYVMFYFNYVDRMHKWMNTPLIHKLFDGPVSITQKILEVPVHLEENGPCIDPVTGEEMDGSAISSLPQSICISIPRLTEKLSQESLRSQTFALVAHEYSHLLGTTEDEANSVQDDALPNFISGDYGSVNEEFGELVRFRGFGINFLKTVPEHIEEIQWVDLKEIVNGDIYRNLTSGMIRRSPFALLPNFMIFESEPVKVRYELLEAAVCVLADDPQKAGCQDRLNKVFRGDSEITYATYMQRLGVQDFDDHPGVVYRRIIDRASARVEIERLVAELAALENYIIALRGY